MKDRILLGLALAVIAGPAFALHTLAVPEPATGAILSVGLVGAYVARKFPRRK
jgi:hypothetical protein